MKQFPKKLYKIVCLICLIEKLAVISFGSMAAYAEEVKSTAVYGNSRVSGTAIIKYAGIKPGSNFTKKSESDALKSLHSTELFKSADLSVSQNKLKIKVTEQPIIASVKIQGNKSVKTKQINEELITSVGHPINEYSLKKDVDKLVVIHKAAGYLSASVESQLVNKKNNIVDVIFKIKQGPKATVSRITFTGNKSIDASKLKNVLISKDSSWINLLGDKSYNPAKIDMDKQRIRQYYQMHGYNDIQVVSTNSTINKKKDSIFIDYTIKEGPRYKYGKVEFDSEGDKDISKLFVKYKGKYLGKYFNNLELSNLVDKLENALNAKGQQNLFIKQDLKIQSDDYKYDIKLSIQESAKIYIDQINISGNSKTNESKLITHLDLYNISEGSYLSKKKIKQAERYLKNLGVFKEVNVTVSDYKQRQNIQAVKLKNSKVNNSKLSKEYKRKSALNAEDKYDLNVDITEGDTISLGANFSYNSHDSAGGQVSFSNRNFLGQLMNLDFSTNISAHNLVGNFFLKKKNAFGRKVDLSGGIYATNTFKQPLWGKLNEEKDSSAKEDKESDEHFDISEIAFVTGFAYDLSDEIRHNVDYKLKAKKLSNQSNDASNLIKKVLQEQANKGYVCTSSIISSFVYSNIDNMYNPKNGIYANLTLEFAGLFGDVHYFKTQAKSKLFKSFLDEKLTFSLAADIGNITGINEKVRITDRFNLGGDNLRGFKRGGAGPRIKADPQESLGGENMLRFAAELNAPITIVKELDLSAYIFTDAGMSWGVGLENENERGDIHDDKFMRMSAGGGLTYNSMFGALTVYLGFPLRQKDYDKTKNLNFSIKSSF